MYARKTFDTNRTNGFKNTNSPNEDRQSDYYKAGISSRVVRLSTVMSRADTNERIREIDFKQNDPCVNDNIEIRIAESVKNKSFAHINEATGEEIEEPHGSVEYTSDLSPDGNETVRKIVYRRLDEGIFTWHEKEEAVRWIRRLDVDRADKVKAVYEDSYIIGRNQHDGQDIRALVRTTINGQLENPESMLVEIGSGPLDTAKVLFEDTVNNFKVVEHKAYGGFKGQREVLGQDENYETVFQDNPDIDKFIEAIRSKVKMLQDDWDKPRNVFSGENGSLDAPMDKITNLIT